MVISLSIFQINYFNYNPSLKHSRFKKEHVAVLQQSRSVGAVFAMAQYFLALSVILCSVVGSLGTTTKPQQQSSGAFKDLCEVGAI